MLSPCSKSGNNLRVIPVLLGYRSLCAPVAGTPLQATQSPLDPCRICAPAMRGAEP